jgi:hypothetical protein
MPQPHLEKIINTLLFTQVNLHTVDKSDFQTDRKFKMDNFSRNAISFL